MRFRSKAKRDKAHANAVRRGKRSGVVRAAKRMALPMEPRRPDPGYWLGELQWRDQSGIVRRWVVRQGARKNSIAVTDSPVRGWDALLTALRKHLAPITR